MNELQAYFKLYGDLVFDVPHYKLWDESHKRTDNWKRFVVQRRGLPLESRSQLPVCGRGITVRKGGKR